MKTAIPWVLAALLGIGCLLLFNGNKEKEAELAKYTSQNDSVDTLRKQTEDQKQTIAQQVDELIRLRKDEEELLRTRNANQQLQRNVSQLASAQSMAAHQRAEDQGVLERLVVQNAELQTGVCLRNLHFIANAKKQWALDTKKGPDDVPSDADLAPYLAAQGQTNLICPNGGVYTVGDVKTLPVCSFPAHVWK